MPNINELELCIDLINSAKTPEEAFSYFCTILAESGYDRIIYTLVTDHPSLDLPKQHGLVTSYPEDWMKYYNENNYMSVDPVVQKVLTSRTPFFWSELVNDLGLHPKSRILMNQAAESGLNSGIASLFKANRERLSVWVLLVMIHIRTLKIMTFWQRFTCWALTFMKHIEIC